MLRSDARSQYVRLEPWVSASLCRRCESKGTPNEPYRRVFEAVFDVEPGPETRFSYLVANCSKRHGVAEGNMEGLINRFDVSKGELTRRSRYLPTSRSSGGLFDRAKVLTGRLTRLCIWSAALRGISPLSKSWVLSRCWCIRLPHLLHQYGRIGRLRMRYQTVGRGPDREGTYARDQFGRNSK